MLRIPESSWIPIKDVTSISTSVFSKLFSHEFVNPFLIESNLYIFRLDLWELLLNIDFVLFLSNCLSLLIDFSSYPLSPLSWHLPYEFNCLLYSNMRNIVIVRQFLTIERLSRCWRSAHKYFYWIQTPIPVKFVIEQSNISNNSFLTMPWEFSFLCISFRVL